jgi:hypothetical protein
MATEKLKMQQLPGVDQIPGEQLNEGAWKLLEAEIRIFLCVATKARKG